MIKEDGNVIHFLNPKGIILLHDVCFIHKLRGVFVHSYKSNPVFQFIVKLLIYTYPSENCFER